MHTDLRRVTGALGEDLAVSHLQRLGHVVLARNHRTRFGEIDVVTRSGSTLVFVEVKTLRGGGGRSPWDSLHKRKREQVRRMATAYLAEVSDRPRTREIRFDAIGIVLAGDGTLISLDHLEAAF